jgi:hypothetical protein
MCVQIEGARFGCFDMCGSHRQLENNSSLPDLYMTIIRVLPVPLGSLTLPNKSSHGSTKTRGDDEIRLMAQKLAGFPPSLICFLLHWLLHPDVTGAHRARMQC